MKKLLLTLLWLFLFQYGMAQIIEGQVLDSLSRLPLANVSIQLGAQKTSTDALGNFRLEAKSAKILTASMVGYKVYKINVSQLTKNKLVILMQAESRQLNEVTVSTGYQSLYKERATGSFSVVGQQRLAEQVGSSVIARLEGITPALTVDRRSNGGSLMIRGLSTLRSDRSPLIVLDNFPYEGDLNNLNPADAESITVLKDAAAASIWGARAGNGVIVITTKKGRYNEKTQFSVGAGFNMLAVPDASYNRNMTATDMIVVEQMLFGKGYYTSSENAVNRPALSPVVEMLIAQRDGRMTAQDLNSGLALLAQQDIAQNYSDAFYKTGQNRQYYADVMGGTAGTRWKFFGGMDDNESVLSARYKRYNLKYEQDWKPLKGLELGVGIAYTQAEANSGRSALPSFSTATGALPSYTRFVDAAGNALAVMKDYSIRYTATAGGGKLLNWDYYPLDESEQVRNTNRTNDFIGNFKASYQILQGLKASVNYQYEKQLLRSKTDYGLNSYYTRNLINQFTQISSTTVSRPIPLGAIRDQGNDELEVNNLRAQLNYDKNWKGFTVNLLTGAERRTTRTVGENSRVYGFDAETLSSASVDYADAYKNFVSGSNSYISDPKGFTGKDTRFVSLYANGAVSYLNRYTVSASARRDGSNLFGVNTNNKWSPLWSAGAAWLLSDEGFLKGMPYTRLRLTYGSSGNASTKYAAVTTISYSGSSPYTQTPLAQFTNYANPDLRWETVSTLNMALDFRLFKNRLTGSIEYYVKHGNDLIANAPIDYTAGVGFVMTKNAAKIRGRGVDIELNSKNLTGTLHWTSDFFINFYRDQVKEYYLESNMASNFVNGDLNINGTVGMPVYAVYGYKWAGLNPVNGNPRGYVNGNVSEDYNGITGSSTTLADLDYVGPAFPTSTGALGNHLAWKHFSLDFRIGFKFGYYFRRPSLSYATLYASRMGDSEYAQRWMQAGDEAFTDVPSQVYPANSARDAFYNYSVATIINGDHIRLQSVGLGYALEREQFKKLPFNSWSFSLQANNLGLLWMANKQKIDPDYPVSKPFKTFSLTTKINF